MDNKFKTPVLFLIFNRSDTTQQVFNQIRQIKPKYLFVAADGPRLDKFEDFEKCSETRNIIKQIDWECELKTLFRETNLGCRVGVSSAITWFFENVEQGIILEDDCFPDLSFFPYCEILLNKFKADNRIFLISGNNFSGIDVKNPNSYYFTKFNSIWGWATWRRAWGNYDVNMPDYLRDKNNLFKHNIYISREATNHYKNGLNRMNIEKNNTWDLAWLYAIIKCQGLSITPQINLVKNIGTDNNSTHKFLKDSFRDNIELGKILLPLKHPEFKISNHIDRLSFDNYRGKSIRRILRIIKENGIGRVFLYYLKVHLKHKLKLKTF